MNFTVADLLTIITAIVALIASSRAGKKAKSDNRNTDADTALKYQELADKSAKAQTELTERLDALSKRMDEKDARIDELERLIKRQSDEIAALNDLLAVKDGRIEELERLTAEQACELEELRARVDSLPQKRSK